MTATGPEVKHTIESIGGCQWRSKGAREPAAACRALMPAGAWPQDPAQLRIPESPRLLLMFRDRLIKTLTPTGGFKRFHTRRREQAGSAEMNKKTRKLPHLVRREMARQTLVLLMLAQPAWSLQLPARAQGGHSRRAALGSGALAAAAVAVAQLPLVASADTMAAMEGTMQGFDSDEIKRAKYQEMQKTYKKAWRKQLSNLEYASSDAEVSATRCAHACLGAAAGRGRGGEWLTFHGVRTIHAACTPSTRRL